ncbi:MAG: MmcQ/YjbR family DNA-binding protein [Oscillospiraceae bacterium]|nr:MmcQ/YjbR family DNA-binding protein [Oscillospiraceae bacterium]
MTKDELIQYALTLSDVAADCPFEADFESTVLRHKDTGKWFGLIMNLNGRDIVNLKCEPINADFLRSVYSGVIPAYHMNKTHWNSVYLSSDVPDDEIKTMTLCSYELTIKKKGRKNPHE